LAAAFARRLKARPRGHVDLCALSSVAPQLQGISASGLRLPAGRPPRAPFAALDFAFFSLVREPIIDIARLMSSFSSVSSMLAIITENLTENFFVYLCFYLLHLTYRVVKIPIS
jgi:hypothetical protein